MKIKKYLEFINEDNSHSFGCVMLELDIDNWKEITSFIKKEDVYDVEGFGIEDEPHVTLLYGLEKSVTTDDVKEKLKDFKDIDVKIESIDIFENEYFDVVKFNVKKTKQLQSIFDTLSKLPNQNKYKDYIPHITIAYVKKGKGKKYVYKDYKHEIGKLNDVIYSKASDDNTDKIILNEK